MTQPSAADPMQPLVAQVEEDLLDQIVKDLENNELSAQQAQKLAQDFLAILPTKDKHDLLIKLRNLGNTYKEAQAVFVKYAVPYEEELRHKKLHKMALLIKKGNIEQAITVAKGGEL